MINSANNVVVQCIIITVHAIIKRVQVIIIGVQVFNNTQLSINLERSYYPKPALVSKGIALEMH